MLCKPKKRDDRTAIVIILCHIKKWHAELDIPAVEEVVHVSSYPMMESMGFDTGIYDGFETMSTVTLLGEIVRLHKCTKHLLKYVHKNSKYGHIVAIPASANQEWSSRSAIEKGRFEKTLIHYSGGK